jgi:hypothetical protein
MLGAAVLREFSKILSGTLPSEHESSDGDRSCPNGTNRELFCLRMRSLQSVGVGWIHFLR